MSNRITVIGLLLAAAGARLGLACDFCSPMTSITLLTELDAADVVLIAELTDPTPIRANPTAFDFMNRDRQKGEAGFVMRRSLRGETETFDGQQITVPLRIPGPTGTLHLITHDHSTDKWSQYRLSEDGRKFCVGVASLPVPGNNTSISDTVLRLKFCLPFLDTDDFLLRRAVFGEFSDAPWSALKQLRPLLHREQVLQWMKPASKRAEEARLIYMLLSLCGNEDDLPMLSEEFHQCLDSNWAGTLDGVILAYVAVGGTDALEDVEAKLLSAAERSIELKVAAAKALRFLIEHESRVARPRLMLSYRLLLKQPQTAELVIADLSRWENWPWARAD